MSVVGQRRELLKSLGIAVAASVVGLTAGHEKAQAAGAPALLPHGATSLRELSIRLERAPRRRDFKSVPMILRDPSQWDSRALMELAAYRSGPKQCWSNSNYASHWLTVMRNTLNTEVFSYRHPDFLCVSGTHGTAHLALEDEAMWEKYRLGRLIPGGKVHDNALGRPTPPTIAMEVEAADGIYSERGETVPVLQRRGVVFMCCHNIIWALSGRLIAMGSNPDHLSQPALAAELTNHLLPGVILTPGVAAAIMELQNAGFAYAAS
ncbi:MAG TPA: hypothetical protein VKV28_09470 [Candidatus Binataceae bacterium]|nr:hypothetical protein [Candidatus Binataceae bacterium]